MIICCSSGKARIYYIKPGKGGLQYKLKGQSTWKKVLADEPLTTKCEDIPGAIKGGQCRDKQYKITIGNDYFYVGENRYREDIFYATGRIDQIEFNVDGEIHVNSFTVGSGNRRVPVVIKGENNTVLTTGEIPTGWDGNNFVRVISIIRTDGTAPADDIAQCGGDNPTKKFTVLGESGRKYVEIQVKECPDVQTVDCIFDEKNTKSIDIELPKKDIPWVSLPTSWIPQIGGYKPFITLDSCIKIVDDSIDKAIEIWIIFTAPGSAIEFDPFNLTGWNKKVKSIPYPKGCPPPKVWVECCPNGICGEDKKCPKETVCQVDCEGFRCCYDGKGKLIKKIKL